MTNGELCSLGEDITDKVVALWPIIRTALKPHEDEIWFKDLDRMVTEYREYV